MVCINEYLLRQCGYMTNNNKNCDLKIVLISINTIIQTDFRCVV